MALGVAVQALAGLHDGGYRVLCSGIRPASVRDPVSQGATVLALVPYGRPAFATPDENGTAVAAPSPTVRAQGTGRPTWFRCLMQDGRTAIRDGDVPEDAKLDRENLLAGDEVRVVEERLEATR